LLAFHVSIVSIISSEPASRAEPVATHRGACLLHGSSRRGRSSTKVFGRKNPAVLIVIRHSGVSSNRDGRRNTLGAARYCLETRGFRRHDHPDRRAPERAPTACRLARPTAKMTPVADPDRLLRTGPAADPR